LPIVRGRLLFGFAVLAASLTACLGDAGSSPPSIQPPPLTVSLVPSAQPPPEQYMPGEPALVTRVVDGDTVDVRFRGREVRIRLIGIDTPETVDPFEPVMCYGPEASAFAANQLEGQRVNLEFDVERLDRYGRTLAYVWHEEQLFNRVLVARGYAVVTTYPPDVKYVERLVAAQRRAREDGRGLWSVCQNDGGANGDGGSGERCDPAYPGVCIPPPPPDLDCGDVSFHGFRVLPPDPHGFDGDHDGIGCET